MIFRWCDCYAPLVGRFLLGGFFLWAGIAKLLDTAGTAGYIEAVGLPLPTALAILALIFEIAVGGSLILGFLARYSALLLAVYTLFLNLVFHMNFADQIQLGFFLHNMTLIGGLLYVSTFGAGGYSIDSVRNTKQRRG